MTGNDKTLRDTISEVVGETITQKETGEGISKVNSDETQSGGTPEYIAGVDISDIPEQDRPRIKQKLEEKLRLLDKGYQPKYQKVAALEKSLEWLASKGVTAERAEKIILNALEVEKNPNPTNQQKKDKRTLDTLMENSPETKSSLEQLRTAIREESEVDELRKKVDSLEKAVNYFQGKDVQLGEQQLNLDLETLKDKFGKNVIEKYEDTVRGEWRKFPNSKAKDILKYVIPDEEYEQALLSKKSKKEDKLNAISSAGAGVSSSSETINIRKTPMSTLLKDALAGKIK